MKYKYPRVIATLGLFFLVVFFTDTAHAYMGPGAGLGMVGSLIAVIVAVLILVFGLVIYPIRLLRKRKSKSKET